MCGYGHKAQNNNSKKLQYKTIKVVFKAICKKCLIAEFFALTHA